MIGKVTLFIKKVMKWYKYDIREQSIENFTYWYSLMNEDKKRRIDRYRIFDDRKRSVTGEMLARKAIAEWCGTKPENIRFKISKYGKPYVANLDVEFNISHSGNMGTLRKRNGYFVSPIPLLTYILANVSALISWMSYKPFINRSEPLGRSFPIQLTAKQIGL